VSQRRGHIEDPGAELLERAGSYWTRYGRILLGGIAAVAAVGAVVFFTLRARAAAEDQAAGQLAEANILFWQGEYSRSLQIAKQVADQFAATPSGVDALRLAGDDSYWNGDFKFAVEQYRRYLDKTKTGVVRDAVMRSYAYALESDHQYRPAADAYDGLVGKFDRESSAEFIASAARCYRALGQPAEAVKRLRRLLDEYGETTYANTARVRLGELTGGSS
jgi:tetratricopeptide (TPR) repeat protein